MSRLEGTTRLRIVEMASLPGRPDRLLIVERIAGGGPSIGMVLRCPEISGSWRITTFGLFQPDPENAYPDRLPIGIVELQEGAELMPGFHLVED